MVKFDKDANDECMLLFPEKIDMLYEPQKRKYAQLQKEKEYSYLKK